MEKAARLDRDHRSVAVVRMAVGQPEEIRRGISTGSYIKDPTDRIWKDDAQTKEWSAFMDRYHPDGDRSSVSTVFSYMAAEALVAVLKQCVDDLTRENVMKQAASLKGLKLPMLLPGITINTGPDDYA
jgi:hypothetical protein